MIVLSELIDRFRGPLIGLIASWGVPWTDAEELAQETFVQAYLARERFTGDSSDVDAIGRWLRGIARNLQRNWQRRSARQPEVEATGETPDPASTATDPENDRVGAVQQAIARLPETLRVVVQMFYLESCSTAEVAALLETTPKAIEGRLRQARALLRERLETSSADV